jgi:DNA-binding response OmpR family regulator
MNVLLVGLGAETGAVVARVLGTRVHEWSVAEDGARAIDLFRDRSPQLMIAQDPLVDMSAGEFAEEKR